MFDVDLTATPPPDDGGLFPASLAATRTHGPALGASGFLVRFLHPRTDGMATGTYFGPGPREGTVAVSYAGSLILVDTTSWTLTT